MKEKIIEVLEKIRPYIQRDGGDVEFVSVDEHGVVTVRMLGACADCLSLDATLSDGIEAILLEEVEGVTAVRLEETQQLF
ncbi:NifU family protein [Anaerorhabdus sp.]|uniref:NifU family protein n=1 Tax=Anaerorhabdus sp. TaxID=1872524 RepID=UPI002FC74655